MSLSPTEYPPANSFTWSKGIEGQPYQVCSLNLFCNQIYTNLKGKLPSEFSFPDRITVSTAEYNRDLEPVILNRNDIVMGLIADFCDNILLINQLSTGSKVLEILDDLLEKNDFYLQISFSVNSEDSPSCSYIQANIVDAEGKPISSAKGTIKLKLSEEKKEFYELPFYNASTGQIVQFKEPAFLVILHELIHGLQNITWRADTHKDILDQMYKNYKSLESVKDAIWLQNFFCSGIDKSNYPDELQVMIIGFEGTLKNNTKVVVSEAMAVNEFLENDELLAKFPSCEYQKFRGQKLYPFGHGIQQGSLENILNLHKLISVTAERKSSDSCCGEVLAFDCLSTTLKNCTIKDVVGDGNCGVWALMQALNPSENFLEPDEAQKDRMKALRTDAASKVPINSTVTKERIATCATNSTDQTHWIATDDFRYFAQLTQVNRPIIIVRFDSTFELYTPTSDATEAQTLDNLESTLQTPAIMQYKEKPVFLLFNGSHYQTLIPTEPSPEHKEKGFCIIA